MADAETHDGPIGELAGEMAWVQRLASALVRGGDAEDVAQEAWMVAAQHRPRDGRPLRPWLARVVLNLVRMDARSSGRRRAREAEAADADEHAPGPDELVQRVELQQRVAAEVLALAEPFRTTVLQRFVEGLSCADIARRGRIPEGTVRRRLKTALDTLRARLEPDDGRRGALLAPLVGIGAPISLGVLAMKKAIAAIALLILLLLAALWWWHRGGSSDEDPSGARTVATSSSTGGTSASSAAAPAPTDAEARAIAWLAQPGARARKIAGHVTFHGQPVAGATVELASLASEGGLVTAPHVVTDAAGAFSFGPRAAMEWSVRASSAGKASAVADVDLRDPTAAPPSDQLLLELGACSAALFGTIRDASGGPIAKASITHVPQRTSSEITGGPTVTSDEKGAYELCVESRWPGWTTVSVSADGYGTVLHTAIVPGRMKIDFALVPEASIVGRVIREDTGAAVPNALVFLPPARNGIESTPRRVTFADPEGRFRIGRLAAGRYTVFARADGLAETARGTPVTVDVGQTSAEIVLRLEPGSTIRGRVMSHDKPVAGAHVTANDATGPRASARSGEDGSFVLAGVPGGDVRFTAFPYEVKSPTTFHVAEANSSVTLEVEERGAITGRVLRGGQPVPGALIDINGPNDNELGEVRAGGDGRFEVHGLAPGPWTLFGSDPHAGAFGRAPETVRLTAGQTAEITIDLAFAAAISGRIVDQDGTPVPGLTVEFINTSSDDAGVAATDADGNFRAASMTGGGQYRPRITRLLPARVELAPARGTDFPFVTVDAGDSEVTGIELAVRIDRLTIGGTVVDGSGAPMPDVRVTALRSDSPIPLRMFGGLQDPAATSDMSGGFSITDLAAGTYTLVAHSSAGIQTSVPGVKAGTGDVKITLPAAGGLQVTTVGFASTPQVIAFRTGNPQAPLNATPQGAGFSFTNLEPGTYVVSARTTSDAAAANATVVAGKTTQVTLTSGGTTTVAGKVHDFKTGRAVEGMTCDAEPRLGDQVVWTGDNGFTRTDATGAFVLTGAPAGQIMVRCRGLGRSYSDGLRVTTVSPGQRVDLDVPVVALSEEPGIVLGGLGARIDDTSLTPRFAEVQPGGPAATAGFKTGDVIIKVDGASVADLSPDGVTILVINRAQGSKVAIVASRGGAQVSGEITLGVNR